jgi:hypothetical protein
VSALFAEPELAPLNVSLLAPPSTLLLALYWAGGDHSVAQQRTFGLTVMACFKVFTSEEKLLFGSILARSEDSPRCPFTLSSANSAVPMLPMLLHALDAPIQCMYWLVVVASTVQVPAYMTGTTNDKSKNKNKLIFFIFHSPLSFFIFIP